MITTIAFDSSSSRHKDDNGYLHVASSKLTREQVASYYGYEIPRHNELGLDSKKIYKVYRPASELKVAASTFNGLPILIKHQADSAYEPKKNLRVGSLGTEAKFDGEYISNALVFHDATAIALIEDGSQKELSAGYYYDAVIENGNFQGQEYEIKMTNIRGNHVALVQLGRAGSTCVVADKDIKNCEDNMADKEKDRIATIDKIAKSSLAKDNQVDKKNDETSNDNGKEVLISKLRELGEQHSLEGSVIDELISMVDSLGLENTNDSDNSVLKDEPEKKSSNDQKSEGNKEGDKMAGDAKLIFDEDAIIQKVTKDIQTKFNLKAEACEKVKPLIGNVSLVTFDSAVDIYGFALKNAGVDISQYPKEAYRGMVDVLIKEKKSNAYIESPLPAFDNKSTIEVNGKTFNFDSFNCEDM